MKVTFHVRTLNANVSELIGKTVRKLIGKTFKLSFKQLWGHKVKDALANLLITNNADIKYFFIMSYKLQDYKCILN